MSTKKNTIAARLIDSEALHLSRYGNPRTKLWLELADGSPLSVRSYRKASDAEAEAQRRGLRVLNACGSRRASRRSVWLPRRSLALLGECVAGLGVVALVAAGAPFAAVVAGLAVVAACGWVVLG